MKLYTIDFGIIRPIDMEKLLNNLGKHDLCDSFNSAILDNDNEEKVRLDELVISGMPLAISASCDNDFKKYTQNLEEYVQIIEDQTGTIYKDDTVFIVGKSSIDSSRSEKVFPVVPFTIKKNRNHVGGFKKVRNKVHSYDFDSKGIKPWNIKKGKIKSTGFIKNDDLILLDAPKLYGSYNGTFNPHTHGGFEKNVISNRLKGYLDFSTYKCTHFSNEEMKTIRVKGQDRGDSCYTMFAYVMMGYKKGS